MTRKTAAQETAVHVGGSWWLAHGLPLVAPGIGCAIWAALVEGAHIAWGGSPVVTPIVTVVFFLLGGALTGYGWLAAGNRAHLKIAITVSGSTATLNLVLGLIFGLGELWLVGVYAVCSVVVWILWGIWRASKYAGATSHDEHGTAPLLEAVRNAQVRISKPQVDDRGVVRAKVTTLPGGTLDDARSVVPLLSAHARAVPGGAHLATHPDRDGVATIEIPTRDNLKATLPWPGAHELVGSLPVDPFPVAEHQSGIAMARMVGDHDKDPSADDIKHVKIGGTTGSGKSYAARVLLASMLVKRRVNVIAIDLTKKMQTFGPLAPGIDWVITDAEEARLFMARISQVIAGRTDHLAGEGLMRWSLRSSLNMLVIYVEESKEFSRFQRQYERAVADSRSAGIQWYSSTQDWIYRNVSTTVRKLHGSAICFGVEEADDAGNVLPDEVIAALGKNGLPTWGSTRPGYCYIAGLGTPRRNWSKMARFYKPEDEQLVEAVELGAQVHDPMDQVTAGLFGELFARRAVHRPASPVPALRERREAPAAWGRSEPLSPRYDRDDEPDEFEQEEAEAMACDENTQDREEMYAALAESRRRNLGEDAEPQDFADVDPDEPIDTEVEDEGEEDDDQARPSPEEAQRLWDERLDALYRSGARHLTTGKLTEWLTDVGRERTFLYRQRDRWIAAGCIQQRPDADGWDIIGSPFETAGRVSPPHGM